MVRGISCKKGKGGVYNVPQGEKTLLYSALTCMGTQNPFPPDPPLKKSKSLVQPIRLAQNPGCEPDAELIQFRKGIVGVYIANYV